MTNKRMIAFLLCFLLIQSLSALAARDAGMQSVTVRYDSGENQTIPTAGERVKQYFSNSKNTMYSVILAGMKNFQEEIPLSGCSDFNRQTFGQDLQATVEKVLNDAPEIFYLNPQYGYYQDSYVAVFTYLYGDSLTEKISAFNAKVDQIIQENTVPMMTDLEKELAIHDYIVKHTNYDTEAANSGADAIIKMPEAFTAYGVIMNGSGVCDSYSKAMKLLLSRLNIPCIRITGTGNGGAHAWNKVQIDGVWYHVDATWNDPVFVQPIDGKENYIRYTYFNANDDQMIAGGHTWKEESYPGTNSTSDKFRFLWEVEADSNNGCGAPYWYNNRLYYPNYVEGSGNCALKAIDFTNGYQTFVLKDNAPYFTVYGEEIYYADYNRGGFIYKMKTDGSGDTLVLPMAVKTLNIRDNILHYRDYKTEEEGAFSLPMQANFSIMAGLAVEQKAFTDATTILPQTGVLSGKIRLKNISEYIQSFLTIIAYYDESGGFISKQVEPGYIRQNAVNTLGISVSAPEQAKGVKVFIVDNLQNLEPVIAPLWAAKE